MDPLKIALAALVVAHFAVSAAHGAAHSGAHVALTPAQLAFVIGVISMGPLAGLALVFFAPRSGSAVVAASMAGALVFGVINHFLLPGADNVLEVDAAWRTMFGSTAALLALIEASGTIVACVALRRYGRSAGRPG